MFGIGEFKNFVSCVWARLIFRNDFTG